MEERGASQRMEQPTFGLCAGTLRVALPSGFTSNSAPRLRSSSSATRYSQHSHGEGRYTQDSKPMRQRHVGDNTLTTMATTTMTTRVRTAAPPSSMLPLWTHEICNSFSAEAVL